MIYSCTQHKLKIIQFLYYKFIKFNTFLFKKQQLTLQFESFHSDFCCFQKMHWAVMDVIVKETFTDFTPGPTIGRTRR